MTVFGLRYRTFIFHLAVLILLAGCANYNQLIKEDRAHSESPIVGFVWDTQGGGDMRFVVAKKGEDYIITVDRYNFRTVKKVIKLTAEDDKPYSLVDGIFERRVDIQRYTYTPRGLTGTWTEITLLYGDRRKKSVEKIDAAGDMGILYRFVDDALKERIYG